MTGNEEFWQSGTWFFLVYGFVLLGFAVWRSRLIERRYVNANPPVANSETATTHVGETR